MLVLAVGIFLSPKSSVIASFCSRTLVILVLLLPYETPPYLENKCTADRACVSKFSGGHLGKAMYCLDLASVSLIYSLQYSTSQLWIR